jgi:hypothetical protein
MNKIKLMFIYLYTIVLFVGLGYAIWGESVTIGSVVKTGDLDVRYVNDSDSLNVMSEKFIEPEISIKGSKQQLIKVTLKNMYPGAQVKVSFEGVNMGTVPASFDFTDSDISGDIELLPYLKYYAGIEIDSNGDKSVDWSCYTQGYLKEMAGNLNDEIKKNRNIFLEPNGAGFFNMNITKQTKKDNENTDVNKKYIIIKFDDNAPSNTQNKRIDYRLNLNFKQYSGVLSKH